VGHRLQRNFGDIVAFRFRTMNMLLLCHPALIHEALVEKNNLFAKDQRYRSIPEVLGDALLTSHGESWLQQKKTLKGLYDLDALKRSVPVIRALIDEMIESWSPGQRRDIHADMEQLTACVSYKLVLGRDKLATKAESAAKLSFLLHYWNHRGSQQILKLPELLTQRRDRRFREVLADLHADIDAAVAAQREHKAPLPVSLLARLAEVQPDGRLGELRAGVREQLLTFLLAGSDTSSSLLSWTLWEIARSDTLQEAVARECSAAPDQLFVSQSCHTPYLDAAINEAARLYPPVWAFGREATQDTALGGCHVAAGTQVVVSPYLVQRDPRFFPRPGEFDANRWLEPAAPPAQCAYIPFGAGARLCIGRPLALLQMKIILATILRRFRLQAVRSHRAVPLPKITLHPKHGLPLDLFRRA
jgi:cytochrome P450